MATHRCIVLDVNDDPIPRVRVTHFHRFCLQQSIANSDLWRCTFHDPPAGPPFETTDNNGETTIGLLSPLVENHYFYAQYNGENLIENGTKQFGRYEVVFRFATEAL